MRRAALVVANDLSILGRMPALPSTAPCTEDQLICSMALDITDNDKVARAADLLIGKPLAIAGLVVLGLLVRWLLHRLVDRLVARAEHGVPSRLGRGAESRAEPGLQGEVVRSRRAQRAKAMGGLLKSIVSVVVITVVALMAIDELGYAIGPLLASAGVLGVALGFGAQSLVKDYLAGVFMIFEDQYGVGDEIDLGEAIGTVEAVGLRVTRLRDVNGTVWYVRNGEILRVGNMSQNWARTVLDVKVGYQEDLARVRRVLQDVAHDLWVDDDFKGQIIEEPSVWGVQDLAPDGVIVRVALKTAPLEQWAIAREMRQRIKSRFDFEGIEIPYPQQVVWHRGSPDTAQSAPDTESVPGTPQSTGPARAEGPA
jgi:small conductance mechanosensitive channel